MNKESDFPSSESDDVRSVPFFRHSLGAQHAQAVAQVLETPFLTSAGVGRDVSEQICNFFDVPHSRLTNSWTNGAVAALMAFDIGPGDEVIVPAMTFIASVNVVELVGARPVFVDCDPKTLLMDLDAVKDAITPKTKGIIPVHLYGQMVDIQALRSVVGDDVIIIEDSAHCFEGALRGEKSGKHSDAAIFSFYATKNVTCGEGGAIILHDDAVMDRLQQTMLHGMSAGADRRFEGALYRHWEMERLGTKANLPDILAALLPAQIETVEKTRHERAALDARYRAAFQNLPMLSLIAEVPDCASAHHLFPIAVPLGLRDQVMHDLNQAGVGATVNYRAVHRMGYYARKYDFAPDAFPVAADWGDRTLCLPLFPGLQAKEQDFVISTVSRILQGLADKS